MDVASFQDINVVHPSRFVNQSDAAEVADDFTAIVHRQSRFVFRVAFAILRNAHDAEDAAQETFLKLYRTGAWKGMQDEKAFLARMTWRIAVDRRMARQRSNSIEAPPGSAAENPESELLAADRNLMVHGFIDSLPEDLRQPLALSTVDELTSREIAVVMGIPEGTVRSRLSRARQILREKIERTLGVRHER